MRVLITGAGGFVGKHLTHCLRGKGAQVRGVGPELVEGFVQVEGDVNDTAKLTAELADFQPDALVHLAGLSSVAQCNQAPMMAFQVNAQGTLSTLLAVKDAVPKCRTLVVSSAEVYGAASSTEPLNESVAPQPINAYGAAKLAAEVVSLQLARAGLEVMVTRPFNHVGAGQSPQFVLPSFAQQLTAVPRGAKVTLEVGNLSAVRDFSHVSDVVEAYALLLEKGVAGEIYNIGSGQGLSIEEVLQRMIRLSGREAEVRVDPKRLRPVEIPRLVSQSGKMAALGWKPKATLDQALSDLLTN